MPGQPRPHSRPALKVTTPAQDRLLHASVCFAECFKGPQALRDLRDLQDDKDPKELKVTRESKVTTDLTARKGLKGLKVFEVSRAPKANPVVEADGDLQVTKVSAVLKAHRALEAV